MLLKRITALERLIHRQRQRHGTARLSQVHGHLVDKEQVPIVWYRGSMAHAPVDAIFSLFCTHCPPDESQPVIERGDASTHASVATACVARMRMATPVRLQSAAEPRAPVLPRSGLRARRQSLFVRSVGLERLPSSV